MRSREEARRPLHLIAGGSGVALRWRKHEAPDAQRVSATRESPAQAAQAPDA